MLYYTTTYYKTQATTGNFTNPTETLRGRPRPAPGREHVGGEKRRRKLVEAFSGAGGSFPRPHPVSCVLGAPGQLGRGALPWACIVIPDDGRSTPAAVIVGSGEAGQLAAWSALSPFPLGVQPAAVPASAGGRGRARRWQTAFPAKPAFLGPLSRCGAR